MPDCIFCDIISGKTTTKIIYEDDLITVFNDIVPKADTHLLMVPKKHIPSLLQITEQDSATITHMMYKLPSLASRFGIDGFRTIINTGGKGRQHIYHLHIHLLAGDLLEYP
jgi:histidine triad (HIT) family protein